MKSKKQNPFLLAAVIVLTLSAPAVFAAALTWDEDTVTAGAQDGGGIWADGAGNWRNVTTSTDNVNWVNANLDAATFGAGTDGTYGITLSGTVRAAGGITFNNSGYTLSGDALSLVNTSTTNGSITVAGGKTATINSAITYNNNRAAAINLGLNSTLNLGGGAGNSQYSFNNTAGGGIVNMTAGTYTANTGLVNVAQFNQTGGTFNLNPGNNVRYDIGNAISQNVNYSISGGILSLNGNASTATVNNAVLSIGEGTASDSAFTSTLTVKTGGTVNVGTTASRSGEIRISRTGNTNGRLDVQGGDLTIGTGSTANKIYLFHTGSSAGISATMTQSGGTVTTNGIQFGGTSGTYDATSSASLTLSGGNLNIGAQGITRGSGAADLPITIKLQGGTLGSTATWASSLNMALGTTGGGPTIDTSGGNIGLSGNLTNDVAVAGTLTKAGGGDLTLSGTNSYSGGTTIQAGRLIIAAGSALPTTGAVQLGNGGDDRLIFNAGGSPTFNQSITIASGAALVMRQAATLTNVTLPTAGLVNFNKDNATTVGFTLDSNVALSGDLTIEVGGGSTAPTQAVTLAGDFSGGFGLIKDQAGELVISGTSTYTGNTLVNNGTLTLASGGGLSFTVGASGVNNQISGDATPGTVSLDGIFSFDLSSAGTTLGDLWNIVDLANLGTVTFGSNFEVADFMDAGGGLWNRNFGGADYQFSTSSGELSVIPEPRAALLGGLGLLALLRRRRA